jgi:prepilin-type N-terminal cleavage/methylation domain-containing protein
VQWNDARRRGGDAAQQVTTKTVLMSMHIHSRKAFRGRRRSAGFTLVELMVALVLGLIVTGAALAMFLTNQRVYNTTESLGRVQENVRTATS